MKNYHIQPHKERHYYSVTYRYISQKVKLVYTATHVPVYHGGEKIATAIVIELFAIIVKLSTRL